MRRRLLVFALALLGLFCLSSSPSLTGRALPPTAAVQAPHRGQRDAELVAAYFALHRASLVDSEVSALTPVLIAEARAASLDPALILAVIDVESDGDAFALSRVGARGLMQLRPATAEAMARRGGLRWKGAQSLFDPITNVRLGVRYLASLRDRFGDLPTALAAYNAGPTRVASHLRRRGAAPAGYSQKVLAVLTGAGSHSSGRI